MSKVYFYKLTADSGGAPCVSKGLLTLAICKPTIRHGADHDDYVLGFAADSLHPDNPLIYAARITDKLRNGLYYADSHYREREDCIYRLKEGRFVRRTNARHHPEPGALGHDIGYFPDYSRANVLLSRDFRYRRILDGRQASPAGTRSAG